VDMDGNGALAGSEIFGWGRLATRRFWGDWYGSGSIKRRFSVMSRGFPDFSGDQHLTSFSIIGLRADPAVGTRLV
jgi:hypothetical protein